MTNTSRELIQDHAQAADAYASYWAYPEMRPEGMSDEETAYFLLLYSGMLYRYTGDVGCVRPLQILEASERERLVGAACRFLAATEYAGRARQLAVESESDAAAEEEFEQYVYEQDCIDVVLRSVKSVGADILRKPGPASEAYWAALQKEFELNDVFDDFPALTATAAQTVLDLQNYIVVGRDDPRAWWLLKLKQMTDRVFSATDIERGIAASPTVKPNSRNVVSFGDVARHVRRSRNNFEAAASDDNSPDE